MALDIFPFYHLSNHQLQDEFATSKEKPKEMLENADLQKFLKSYKQFFNQLGIDCWYFVEDELTQISKIVMTVNYHYFIQISTV